MSADKRKSLAIETAYLRLASRDIGMGTNNKWMRARTKFLDKMAERGLITYRTVRLAGRKTVTTAFATPAGAARLAETLKRFGDDYGPIAAISRIEPARGMNKARPFDPTPRHLKARRAEQLRQGALSFISAIRRAGAARQTTCAAP